MIEFILAYFWVLIVPVEIALLFVFYKYYFAEYNAQRWLSKAQDENFLEGLLRPVLDIIVDESTDSIASRMKMELLSAQGVMSKQVLGNINPENAEEQVMAMSTSLLKSIGYRNPNPIIVMKLAQGIGGMAEKFLGQNESVDTGNTMPVKMGAELFEQ